jgi:probable DNA metabolism protein
MVKAEIAFRHDGTFPGLICAAATAFKNRIPFSAVPRLLSDRNNQLKNTTPSQTDLFDHSPGSQDLLVESAQKIPVKEIKSDLAMARRFWTILQERSCSQAIHLMFSAWHSDFLSLDEDAAFFLAACFDNGASAIGNLADPHIGRIVKAAQRANREKHLFLGLVRFRLLSDETYYAPINPDCDILPLIVGHFHKRFFNQDWVIHDVHRGKALFHKKGGATVGTMIEAFEGMELSALKKSGQLPDNILAPAEKAVQAAFRLYYNDISIPERKNTSVRRNFMPKKYWLHLIETPGSDESGSPKK